MSNNLSPPVPGPKTAAILTIATGLLVAAAVIFPKNVNNNHGGNSSQDPFSIDDQPGMTFAKTIGTKKSTTHLISSQFQSRPKIPVSFRALITPDKAKGTVDFYVNGTFQKTVKITKTIMGNSATYATQALKDGNYTILAKYSGDEIHAPSQATIKHTVCSTCPVKGLMAGWTVKGFSYNKA